MTAAELKAAEFQLRLSDTISKIAAVTEARTKKMMEENEARAKARVTPTRKQPSRAAKSKSKYA
jgi:uncharacterized membrane protein